MVAMLTGVVDEPAMQAVSASDPAELKKTAAWPDPEYDPEVAKVPEVKPISPTPLPANSRPTMTVLEGFAPVQVHLVLTVTFLALDANAEQAPAIFVFPVLVALILIAFVRVDPEVCAGTPPEQWPAVKLTVTSSLLAEVPVGVRAGLKLADPPTLHVTGPVPTGVLATAVPSRNATLVSGSATARTPMKTLRLLIWMDITGPLHSLCFPT